MEKRITNTQYLKVGMETNVGIVKLIHDNQKFMTTDGWSHHLKEEEVYLIEYGVYSIITGNIPLFKSPINGSAKSI